MDWTTASTNAYIDSQKSGKSFGEELSNWSVWEDEKPKRQSRSVTLRIEVVDSPNKAEILAASHLMDEKANKAIEDMYAKRGIKTARCPFCGCPNPVGYQTCLGVGCKKSLV